MYEVSKYFGWKNLIISLCLNKFTSNCPLTLWLFWKISNGWFLIEDVICCFEYWLNAVENFSLWPNCMYFCFQFNQWASTSLFDTCKILNLALLRAVFIKAFSLIYLNSLSRKKKQCLKVDAPSTLWMLQNKWNATFHNGSFPSSTERVKTFISE